MFTILNIINYFTGKYVPPFLLILITISVYFYIIYNWIDSLINENIIYLILLLLIMLIDITSLVIIFTNDYYSNYDETNVNSNTKHIEIKKKLKQKKSKNSNTKNKNKDKAIKNNIDNNINNNQNQNNNANINQNINNIELEKKSKISEIISLYDIGKDISLKTYHLM